MFFLLPNVQELALLNKSRLMRGIRGFDTFYVLECSGACAPERLPARARETRFSRVFYVFSRVFCSGACSPAHISLLMQG